MHKLILFDWGNVLLDSHSDGYTIFNAREDIAGALKPQDTSKFMSMFDKAEFWTLSGIQLNDFIESILEQSGCSCTVDEFKDCYLRYYRKVPWYQEMKKLIGTLLADGRFHLGILSTLCEMDLKLLTEHLPVYAFDYRFFSFNLGVQKPGRRIYEIVETVTGYAGEDILLIDDMEQNVNAAKLKRWYTVLATGHDTKKIAHDCYSFMGMDYENERFRKAVTIGAISAFSD